MWFYLRLMLFRQAVNAGLEKTTDVIMFGDYHKEISCQGKIVEVMFVLRVMRKREEKLFKDELIKVAIKGKDIKTNSEGLWKNTFSFWLPFLKFIYLFIYFWLCWVFVSVRGLSLVAASGGHSSLRCAGLSPSRPLLLRSTGSRCAGSVAVARGPSCSAACGIPPDQGPNPCLLHWQADSQPLHHQGSPDCPFLSLK